MRTICVLVGLVAFAPSSNEARADWQTESFKQLNFGADVRDVVLTPLSGGRDYDYVLVGSIRRGELWVPGVQLLRCGRDRCSGERVNLRHGDRVGLALVDLGGAATAIEPRPASSRPLATRRLRRPALAIETTWERQDTAMTRSMKQVIGTATDRELIVVSLRRRDRKRHVMFRAASMRKSASGAGFHSSFALVRARRSRLLAIEESRQKLIDRSLACIRPDPITVRYVWVAADRRYVDASKLALRGGCR